MRIFYDEAHLLHDPGVLPQPEGGSHNYYSEVALRGVLIAEAVTDAQLGALERPADFGMDPILAVHATDLVELLHGAYERMVHEVHGGRLRPRVVLPEVFAVRYRPAQPPVSIWAALGYYAYDTSSPIFARTWEAVYAAAQGALSAANAVSQGERVAYALCRPPGHHASHSMFGGFCYLNNAAIAAQWLARQGARVAILDVDYHHGNGTQAIFEDRADILTVSIHVDPDEDYPFFWGFHDERGSGAGEGFNMNLPLQKLAGEAEYLSALDTAIAAVRRFAPDSLVVSLGVDTYAGDPVGGFLLEGDSFLRLGERIGGMHLPTVVAQEGGYALDGLGRNVVNVLRGVATA